MTDVCRNTWVSLGIYSLLHITLHHTHTQFRLTRKGLQYILMTADKSCVNTCASNISVPEVWQTIPLPLICALPVTGWTVLLASRTCSYSLRCRCGPGQDCPARLQPGRYHVCGVHCCLRFVIRSSTLAACLIIMTRASDDTRTL